jgi:GH43 family beta-xylosidase
MHILRSLIVCLGTVTGLVHAANFTSPLKDPNGSDPFIVYDGGYYYFTTTTWTDVQITRAKTLEGLKTGERKVAWKDSNTSRCCQVWAPGMYLSNALMCLS